MLEERDFRLFFTGYVVSLVGAAMVPVALTFGVLERGGNAGEVGEVLAAETVPLLVLLLFGGVIADRFSRRAAMIGADVARFVSEGLLAGLVLSGSPPLWVFMVLAGVLGAGQAFFNPALTGLMPQLVPPGLLQQANALRGMAMSGGQVAGPALAGVIVAVGGPGWAFGVDALTYAVSGYCLLRVRIPAGPRPPRQRMWSEFAAGWSEFRSRSWLWLFVTQFASFNLFAYAPFMVLGAVLAHERLGGAAAWGVILAALGAGNVLGALVMVRVHPRRPLVVSALGSVPFALPLACIALGAGTAVIAICAGVAGAALSVGDTLWETTLQQQVPADVLSRVSSYDWLGSLAFVPLGYAAAGTLGVALGIRTALLAGAALMLITCLAVWRPPASVALLFRRRWRRRREARRAARGQRDRRD